MNTFRTKDLLEVGAGSVLALTPEQAKRRMPKLEELGKGRYRAKVPVQFKKGEVFGLEGELPKAHQHLAEKEKASSLVAKAKDLLGASK